MRRADRLLPFRRSAAACRNPSLPAAGSFVYNASLAPRGPDPEGAAGRAEGVAYEYGGYLVGTHTWKQDGGEIVNVTLAVPLYSFDALHEDLLRQGSWRARACGRAHRLRPRRHAQLFPDQRRAPPPHAGVAWYRHRLVGPGQTFARALQVSVAIFGFLANILIWLVVVLGPFVLLAWGGWALFSRLAHKT